MTVQTLVWTVIVFDAVVALLSVIALMSWPIESKPRRPERARHRPEPGHPSNAPALIGQQYIAIGIASVPRESVVLHGR